VATSDYTVRFVGVFCEGSFNPAILHPDWLLRHDLIDHADRDAAIHNDDFVVTADVARVVLKEFFIQVEHHQLAVVSVEATRTHLLIRDIAVALFRLLPHTPISRIAIDWNEHARRANTDWKRLSSMLTTPGAGWELPLEQPVLESVEFASDHTSGKGQRSVTVERSLRDGFDVFVGVRDRFDFSDARGDGVSDALAVLDDRWEDSAAFADDAFASVERLRS
jgi:hypothetical protein